MSNIKHNKKYIWPSERHEGKETKRKGNLDFTVKKKIKQTEEKKRKTNNYKRIDRNK